MLRRAVLAVVGLVLPQVVAAGEADLTIAELGPSVIVAAPTSTPFATRGLPTTPSARLVWIDPTSAAFGTEAVVRPEVIRLLREMGVEASWRRGQAQEIAQPSELRVIFLNRATERAPGASVLGATPAGLQGDPFLWIHVPSVRAAAGIMTGRSGPSLDIYTARRLGIALARVITHEVVHALAPSLPHGTGLMSAQFSQAMLTAPGIRVDPAVGLAVRAALLGGVRVARPEGDILAVETTRGEGPKP